MGLFKDCGCGCNGKKQENKLIISIISALTFFIVANPDDIPPRQASSGTQDRHPHGMPLYDGSPRAYSRLHLRRVGHDEH